MEANTIYETVNSKYSSLAASHHAAAAPSASAVGEASSLPFSVQSDKVNQIASSFGYSAADLASLPSGTNLGVSCGNPLATANLQPWETMVDFGSGGGLDCLIAARRMVEATSTSSTTTKISQQTPSTTPTLTGRIYGVDRSADMIRLARRNAAASSPRLPEGLVQFIHAPITAIPPSLIPNGSVDLIVSNCVINLVPDADKPLVFREMYRLLKPGGRVALSDILAKQPLPDRIRSDAALLVGCVAGASRVEQYRAWMEEAGFDERGVVFVDTGSDLNVYRDGEGEGCCGDNSKKGEAEAEAKEENCGGGDGGGGGGGGKKCAPQSCCSREGPDVQVGAAEAQPSASSGDEVIDFNEWVASYQIYAVK